MRSVSDIRRWKFKKTFALLGQPARQGEEYTANRSGRAGTARVPGPGGLAEREEFAICGGRTIPFRRGADRSRERQLSDQIRRNGRPGAGQLTVGLGAEELRTSHDPHKPSWTKFDRKAARPSL